MCVIMGRCSHDEPADMSHLVYSASVINGLVGAAIGSLVGAGVGGKVAWKVALKSIDAQKALAVSAAESQRNTALEAAETQARFGREAFELAAQEQATQARRARGVEAAARLLDVLYDLPSVVETLSTRNSGRPQTAQSGPVDGLTRPFLDKLRRESHLAKSMLTDPPLVTLVDYHWIVFSSFAGTTPMQDASCSQQTVLSYKQYLERRLTAYIGGESLNEVDRPPAIHQQTHLNLWVAPDLPLEQEDQQR